MKKTTAKKLANDYEVKDDASMTDKEAKALLIRGVQVALESLERQSRAYEQIAAALTLYAKTDAEYDPSEKDAMQKKYLDEIIVKASAFFDKIASPGKHELSLDDKTRQEKAKKANAKRQSMLRAAWEKSEKPRHGAECDYEECVCPLYFNDPRARAVDMGLPSAMGYAQRFAPGASGGYAPSYTVGAE